MGMNMQEAHALRARIWQDAPFLDAVYLTWAPAGDDRIREHDDLMVVIEGSFFHTQIDAPSRWERLVQQLQVDGVLGPLVLEAWAQQQMHRRDLPERARPTPRGDDDLLFDQREGEELASPTFRRLHGKI